MLQKIRAWWMTGKKIEEDQAEERKQAAEAQARLAADDPLAIREDEQPLTGWETTNLF